MSFLSNAVSRWIPKTSISVVECMRGRTRPFFKALKRNAFFKVCVSVSVCMSNRREKGRKERDRERVREGSRATNVLVSWLKHVFFSEINPHHFSVVHPLRWSVIFFISLVCCWENIELNLWGLNSKLKISSWQHRLSKPWPGYDKIIQENHEDFLSRVLCTRELCQLQDRQHSTLL